MPTVAALYRYPVKGLSAEPLAEACLTPGEPIPFDRAYAIENGRSPFDPLAPKTLPKIYYLMLMRNERLAELTTRYTEATGMLSVRRNGAVVAEGCLETAEGRRAIEAYFDEFEADELRGPTRVLSAPGFSFSDTAAKVLSLINLETVKAIGRDLGADVHPLRFRGNLYVDGLPAWDEFGWVGREIVVGDVRLSVTKRIDRCAATNVNPLTAERDLNIPFALQRGYGHADCGIYLEVTTGGTLAVGDTLSLA